MSVSPFLLQRSVPFCPRLFVGTALSALVNASFYGARGAFTPCNNTKRREIAL